MGRDAKPDGAASPAERFDLTGRTALVTGGSRGLGRAIALGLAAAGADVAIASRKLEACERVAAEVREATGRRALPFAVDVSRWEQLEPLVDEVYAAFGKLDVLINNAGKSPLYPSVEEIDEAYWDGVLGLNLKGPFRLSALVGSRMARGDGGSIVNVSSVAARHPRPGSAPYAAAKAGLDAITVALAHAWGPAVRVNAILPGTFLTDVSRAWDMEAFGRQAERYALRRGGAPEEIVGAALYLASDASSYTTGALLNVDGGYLPD
ncbi:MAG TPA: glucose 1-dehydrogenase [Solirubrobacterales bacterium]|jgi:NAD(P)-dependent dehydrogenase (short-subunit alcohol dehydrogenase family)|nr:glucose 1-dehydrogenase [Solirubrobacterales bacterium]